jgi:hypothetical protein
MSEPTRLLDGDLPADIAAVLRSATRDVPPAEEEEKRRICATAAEGALWSAPPARPRPRREVAWIGLAVAVVSIGAAGLRYGGAPSAPEALPTQLTGAPPNTVMPLTESEPPVAALPSLRVEELPSALTASEASEGTARGDVPRAKTTSSPAAPATIVTAARAPAREATNVADELKLIDAARGALAAGEPAAAHSHIQRYRSSFPNPHFVDEADALEVQALAALGRSDEARTKAKLFLHAHPGSPYTQRVRSAAGLPSGAANARQ